MAHNNDFSENPLLSAELHYFRVPRDDWELMLVRMRQLGANTISTYVPWAWHEPRTGALDLDGSSHPLRDLIGFVRLCGRMGFRLILKPGPFVNAELLGGGIPPWLLREHPEIHALHPDGTTWRHSGCEAPRACYLHPTYLAEAHRWIAAFSTATLPLQHPAGLVVALQADNATPSDGMLPTDIEPGPHFKLDYNPYVVNELWPRWRTESLADERSGTIPRMFEPPTDLGGLRQYVELVAFTDWFYTTAVATVAGWLREEGWTVPVYHDLLAARWEASGSVAGLQRPARASGWLGHNVYAEAVHDPRGGGMSYRLSFEEYVHYAHWRTRLVKHLSPSLPAFVPESSAAQDFSFAAPFVGGLQGINIHMGVQTQPDNPGIGALPRWAMEGLVQPDGGVRPRFWNAKTPYTLLGAAAADFATARAPADLALGYSHVPERVGNWNQGGAAGAIAGMEEVAEGCDHALRSQVLAQRLVRAGVAFDVLDLDTATPEELMRYALLVVPAATMLARATQAKLAGCTNLALVGAARTRYDENLDLCTILDDAESVAATLRQGDEETVSLPLLHLATRSLLRLPEDVSGAQLGELVEGRGGNARYAWADGEDVDVSVRYGAANTYLFIANRRPAPYTGTLTYRALDGSIQHLHAGIGGPRVGIVMLKDDEVVGAAIGGDGAEGGWLMRGMHTSIVFNNGAGVVAPCGDGLLFSAPQSGRFQVRQPAGWDGLAAYRLLLGGALLPATFQTDGAHMTLPYTAEDERGQTNSYILLPEGAPLPDILRDQTTTALLARAATLRRAVAAATERAPAAAAEVASALAQAVETFAKVARDLEDLAARAYTLDEYGAAWDAAAVACSPSIERLTLALTCARGDHLAGALATPIYEELERRIAHILGIVVRGSLEYDRE